VPEIKAIKVVPAKSAATVARHGLVGERIVEVTPHQADLVNAKT
jgi:ABC-type transporter Mla subunit MlaD